MGNYDPLGIRDTLGIHRLRGTDDLSRAVNLVTRFGLDICVHNDTRLAPGVRNYDGHTINVAGDAHHAASNAVHDLAHWMVAAPQRRNSTNFGWRRGPDEDFRTAATPAKKYGANEEQLASALGVLIETAYDLTWADTIEEHCWVPTNCPTHPLDDYSNNGRLEPLTCRRCWATLHRDATTGWRRYLNHPERQ